MFRERSEFLSEARDVVTLAASTAAEAPRAGRQLIATIGIDSYQHWRRLHNAVGDAQGAAALFRRLGFEDVVPPLLDDRATGAAIDALVTDQLRRLDSSDSLVIFYAGHGGVRKERVGAREVRTGYLIPVDASDDDEQIASWIELDTWLRRIARLPPRHILVILDACFSGIALSSAVKWGRDSGTLLALPFAAANARPSRLVITSARDDERAMDCGPRPGHSLFTGCLIDALTGGVSPVGVHDGHHLAIGSDVASYVRRRVQEYDGRPGWQQTPDFGTFDYDERGEMLIPVLLGDDRAVAPVRFARGSIGELDEPETTEPMVAASSATESSVSDLPPTEPMVIEPRPSGSMVFRPSPAAPPQGARWITASAAIACLAGVGAILWYGSMTAEDPALIVVPPQISGASEPVPSTVEPDRSSPGWTAEDHVPAPVAPPQLAVPAPSPPALPRAALRAAEVALPAAGSAAQRICPTRIMKPRGAEVSWNGIAAAVPTQPLPLPCGVQVEIEARMPRHPVQKKLVIASEDRKEISLRLTLDPAAKVARSRSR